MSQLYNYSNFNTSTLNESFARIAYSATAYARQNGVSGLFSEPAPGISQAYVTVYYIRWVWLIYLVVAITLVLSSFIPTTFVLFKERDRPERDWKGSILPLLIYGLDDYRPSVKMAQRNKMNIVDIEDFTKRLRVELT